MTEELSTNSIGHCKVCMVEIGVEKVPALCSVCENDKRLLDAVDADRLELIKLRSIAKRAGAWQDKYGNWLYGSDPVTCEDHDVVYKAQDIEPNLRRFYCLKG